MSGTRPINAGAVIMYRNGQVSPIANLSSAVAGGPSLLVDVTSMFPPPPAATAGSGLSKSLKVVTLPLATTLPVSTAQEFNNSTAAPLLPSGSQSASIFTSLSLGVGCSASSSG